MSGPRSEARSDSGARALAGTIAVTYAKADSKLLKHFENSRFTSVTEMLNEGNGTAPKHNGEDVCLTWALKGSCTSKCKRSGSHVTYPASVKESVELLVDGCKFDLRAFYEHVIQPDLSGTPAQAARIEPVANWFRVACTEVTAEVSIPLGLTPRVGLDVQTTSQFYQWVESHRANSMAKIRAIGPGLTSAAFDTGVNRITRASRHPGLDRP